MYFKWIAGPGGKWFAGDSYNYYDKTSGGSIVLPNGEVVECKTLNQPRRGYREHFGTCAAQKKVNHAKNAHRNDETKPTPKERERADIHG